MLNKRFRKVNLIGFSGAQSSRWERAGPNDIGMRSNVIVARKLGFGTPK